MSSDPRRGLFIALFVMALAAAWFAALSLFEAPLRDALGMNRHAITFLAVVTLVFAGATAFVFARCAAVRDELLDRRRVIADWPVDPATWAAAVPKTLAADAREKRAALVMVLGMLFVVFAAVSIADADAAPAMMSIAALVAAALVAAFVIGGRIRRSQLRFRDGVVIVGERGLLSNGVLHVWALPLTRLVGARLGGRPKVLTVAYAWFGRTGWQEAVVDLPVTDEAMDAAARCGAALTALAAGRPAAGV